MSLTYPDVPLMPFTAPDFPGGPMTPLPPSDFPGGPTTRRAAPARPSPGGFPPGYGWD